MRSRAGLPAVALLQELAVSCKENSAQVKVRWQSFLSPLSTMSTCESLFPSTRQFKKKILSFCSPRVGVPDGDACCCHGKVNTSVDIFTATGPSQWLRLS